MVLEPLAELFRLGEGSPKVFDTFRLLLQYRDLLHRFHLSGVGPDDELHRKFHVG